MTAHVSWTLYFLLLSDRVESPIYFLCVTVCVKEHRMCVFRCVVWKEIISETVLRRLLFCCCSELHPGSCGPELLRCSAQWTQSPLEPWGTIPAAGRRRNTAVHKLLSDLSFLHFNFTLHSHSVKCSHTPDAHIRSFLPPGQRGWCQQEAGNHSSVWLIAPLGMVGKQGVHMKRYQRAALSAQQFEPSGADSILVCCL